MSLLNYMIQNGFTVSLLVNAALFIPQIITLVTNKSAKSLSAITFIGFNIIQLFTLLHGLITHDYLLAAGYFLSVITCGMLSVLIIYYQWLNKNQGDR